MPLPKFLIDVKVPMCDGVRLSANVYFPEGDSPFPVVLNSTPFGKDSSGRIKRICPNTHRV